MSSMGPGMCMAMPDVCKTPIPPAGPVPIPYPNMGMTTMSMGAAETILVDMMPACNLMSEITLSQGDEAGVAMGVESSLIMGPIKYEMGSDSVLLESQPAAMLTSTTGHNGMSPNAEGVMSTPSQAFVMVGA